MSFWTPLLWFAIILPLLLIAQFTSKKTNPKYLFLFVVYFLVDAYLQFIGGDYINLDFLNLQWNWAGKVLSLILSISFILFHSKQIRRDIGFTTKFNRKTLSFGILIFLGFLAFDFIFKMILFPNGGQFDLENFLFQATMPGLAEELVYRGILLWLLSKAFVPTKTIKGVQFGWGFIIITFLFAMIHGVGLTENLELKLDIVTILYLFLITSLSVSILRKFSGNLILPVLGHNVVNVMNAVIRIL